MKLKTIAWSLLSILKFAVIEAKFLLEMLVDVRIVWFWFGYVLLYCTSWLFIDAV